MSITLLLVEDTPEQMLSFRLLAEEAGFEDIVEVTTLADAIKVIEEQSFDAAVVDLNLNLDEPRMKHGLGPIQMLSQKQPRPLILAFTGKDAERGGAEAGIAAMGAGATDFICDNWFSVNWKQLLRQKLKIWYGHLKADKSHRANEFVTN